ncbi:M20 aminoacylase family protein [Mesorhizobium sp. L-8-3]|uniref:M20 aminoacylase family protein n=1 Tax=Mesorhizobium sp. L-8-3 TaxID=2744522 RepID=UPI0019276555|nr:M20 aminoacylase family protein [Mesorhizobium sp. L-8-3]BCH22731.1 amidohydrolase [Mesorhizobium sp. L-8-3]
MTLARNLDAIIPDIVAWRHDFHEHPELLYDVHRTAGVVERLLGAFGCDEVVGGIGRTGVVGVIRGTRPGKVIGLRADMDALPIEETTNLPYRSKTFGLMHACGHDGHTAMLLGAARIFAGDRDFAGTVVVIFQPAEEGGAGARAMIEDGLLERFGIEEVYGMHNMPGLAVGRFALRPGPLMAAADKLTVEIEGRGGHAARPHLCVDPILVGSHIVTQLQSLVARNVDPLESAVVSITSFEADGSHNIIPQKVVLRGTARTLRHEVQDLVEARFVQVAEGTAALHGATARAVYERLYPITANDPGRAAFAARVAADVAGPGNVNDDTPPRMGGEDFSFMLEKRPGAIIFLGNGDSAGLHHPAYDFDDSAIRHGVSYWLRLVETASQS